METISKSVLFILLLLVPTSVSAKVLISEIMYDLAEGSDSGREWIEVFNNYTSAVVLTDWRLNENDTNHKINSFSGGESLSSGAYAIIADNPAKFLADWPNYKGQVFDSAFSLKNSGETLIVRDSELIDIDTVSFSPDAGAAGDGNSLQRSSSGSSSFAPNSPTPGNGPLTVTESDYKEPTSSDGPEEIAQTPSTGSSVYSPPEPRVNAYIGDDRDVIVGADTMFKARALDSDGNLIERNARYIWNFGDGETKEGESVVHVWKHPGRYVLVLDVAYNKFAASDKIVVTAHSAEINVSVFENGDVALNNNGTRDLNISFWHLRSSGLHFTIPENTFLLSKETVRFSKETTSLPVGDEVALLYPNGTVAYQGGIKEEIVEEIVETVENIQKVTVVPDNTIIDVEREVVPKEDESVQLEQVAAVAAATKDENDFLPSAPWTIGLILFVGLGALGAAAARSASRDEYTIIEED